MTPFNIKTARLQLRYLRPSDATFIIRLLNEPGWIENIGDNSVNSEEDAIAYLENGPIRAYRTTGCGLYAVTLHSGKPIGLCGLIDREGLDGIDLGFAFLEEYQHCGYAHEAACAVICFARDSMKLERLLAISLPENRPSINLLVKLGFKYHGLIRLADDDVDLSWYQLDLRSASLH